VGSDFGRLSMLLEGGFELHAVTPVNSVWCQGLWSVERGPGIG